MLLSKVKQVVLLLMMTYDVKQDDIIAPNKLVFNRLNHIMMSN